MMKMLYMELTDDQKFDLMGFFHQWYGDTAQDTEQFAMEYYHVTEAINRNEIPYKLDYLLVEEVYDQIEHIVPGFKDELEKQSKLSQFAIDSMNYFFFRYVFKGERIDVICTELDNFLEQLNYSMLPEENKKKITEELFEGEYFNNPDEFKNEAEVRTRLRESIVEITGDHQPGAYAVYSEIIEEVLCKLYDV